MLTFTDGLLTTLIQSSATLSGKSVYNNQACLLAVHEQFQDGAECLTLSLEKLFAAVENFQTSSFLDFDDVHLSTSEARSIDQTKKCSINKSAISWDSPRSIPQPETTKKSWELRQTQHHSNAYRTSLISKSVKYPLRPPHGPIGESEDTPWHQSHKFFTTSHQRSPSDSSQTSDVLLASRIGFDLKNHFLTNRFLDQQILKPLLSLICLVNQWRLLEIQHQFNEEHTNERLKHYQKSQLRYEAKCISVYKILPFILFEEFQIISESKLVLPSEFLLRPLMYQKRSFHISKYLNSVSKEFSLQDQSFLHHLQQIHDLSLGTSALMLTQMIANPHFQLQAVQILSDWIKQWNEISKNWKLQFCQSEGAVSDLERSAQKEWKGDDQGRKIDSFKRLSKKLAVLTGLLSGSISSFVKGGTANWILFKNDFFVLIVDLLFSMETSGLVVGGLCFLKGNKVVTKHHDAVHDSLSSTKHADDRDDNDEDLPSLPPLKLSRILSLIGEKIERFIMKLHHYILLIQSVCLILLSLEHHTNELKGSHNALDLLEYGILDGNAKDGSSQDVSTTTCLATQHHRLIKSAGLIIATTFQLEEFRELHSENLFIQSVTGISSLIFLCSDNYSTAANKTTYAMMMQSLLEETTRLQNTTSEMTCERERLSYFFRRSVVQFLMQKDSTLSLLTLTTSTYELLVSDFQSLLKAICQLSIVLFDEQQRLGDKGQQIEFFSHNEPIILASLDPSNHYCQSAAAVGHVFIANSKNVKFLAHLPLLFEMFRSLQKIIFATARSQSNKQKAQTLQSTPNIVLASVVPFSQIQMMFLGLGRNLIDLLLIDKDIQRIKKECRPDIAQQLPSFDESCSFNFKASILGLFDDLLGRTKQLGEMPKSTTQLSSFQGSRRFYLEIAALFLRELFSLVELWQFNSIAAVTDSTHNNSTHNTSSRQPSMQLIKLAMTEIEAVIDTLKSPSRHDKQAIDYLDDTSPFHEKVIMHGLKSPVVNGTQSTVRSICSYINDLISFCRSFIFGTQTTTPLFANHRQQDISETLIFLVESPCTRCVEEQIIWLANSLLDIIMLKIAKPSSINNDESNSSEHLAIAITLLHEYEHLIVTLTNTIIRKKKKVTHVAESGQQRSQKSPDNEDNNNTTASLGDQQRSSSIHSLKKKYFIFILLHLGVEEPEQSDYPQKNPTLRNLHTTPIEKTTTWDGSLLMSTSEILLQIWISNCKEYLESLGKCSESLSYLLNMSDRTVNSIFSLTDITSHRQDVEAADSGAFAIINGCVGKENGMKPMNPASFEVSEVSLFIVWVTLRNCFELLKAKHESLKDFKNNNNVNSSLHYDNNSSSQSSQKAQRRMKRKRWRSLCCPWDCPSFTSSVKAQIGKDYSMRFAHETVDSKDNKKKAADVNSQKIQRGLRCLSLIETHVLLHFCSMSVSQKLVVMLIHALQEKQTVDCGRLDQKENWIDLHSLFDNLFFSDQIGMCSLLNERCCKVCHLMCQLVGAPIGNFQFFGELIGMLQNEVRGRLEDKKIDAQQLSLSFHLVLASLLQHDRLRISTTFNDAMTLAEHHEDSSWIGNTGDSMSVYDYLDYRLIQFQTPTRVSEYSIAKVFEHFSQSERDRSAQLFSFDEYYPLHFVFSFGHPLYAKGAKDEQRGYENYHFLKENLTGKNFDYFVGNFAVHYFEYIIHLLPIFPPQTNDRSGDVGYLSPSREGSLTLSLLKLIRLHQTLDLMQRMWSLKQSQKEGQKKSILENLTHYHPQKVFKHFLKLLIQLLENVKNSKNLIEHLRDIVTELVIIVTADSERLFALESPTLSSDSFTMSSCCVFLMSLLASQLTPQLKQTVRAQLLFLSQLVTQLSHAEGSKELLAQGGLNPVFTHQAVECLLISSYLSKRHRGSLKCKDQKVGGLRFFIKSLWQQKSQPEEDFDIVLDFKKWLMDTSSAKMDETSFVKHQNKDALKDHESVIQILMNSITNKKKRNLLLQLRLFRQRVSKWNAMFSSVVRSQLRLMQHETNHEKKTLDISTFPLLQDFINYLPHQVGMMGNNATHFMIDLFSSHPNCFIQFCSTTLLCSTLWKFEAFPKNDTHQKNKIITVHSECVDLLGFFFVLLTFQIVWRGSQSACLANLLSNYYHCRQLMDQICISHTISHSTRLQALWFCDWTDDLLSLYTGKPVENVIFSNHTIAAAAAKRDVFLQAAHQQPVLHQQQQLLFHSQSPLNRSVVGLEMTYLSQRLNFSFHEYGEIHYENHMNFDFKRFLHLFDSLHSDTKNTALARQDAKKINDNTSNAFKLMGYQTFFDLLSWSARRALGARARVWIDLSSMQEFLSDTFQYIFLPSSKEFLPLLSSFTSIALAFQMKLVPSCNDHVWSSDALLNSDYIGPFTKCDWQQTLATFNETFKTGQSSMQCCSCSSKYPESRFPTSKSFDHPVPTTHGISQKVASTFGIRSDILSSYAYLVSALGLILNRRAAYVESALAPKVNAKSTPRGASHSFESWRSSFLKHRQNSNDECLTPDLVLFPNLCKTGELTADHHHINGKDDRGGIFFDQQFVKEIVVAAPRQHQTTTFSIAYTTYLLCACPKIPCWCIDSFHKDCKRSSLFITEPFKPHQPFVEGANQQPVRLPSSIEAEVADQINEQTICVQSSPISFLKRLDSKAISKLSRSLVLARSKMSLLPAFFDHNHSQNVSNNVEQQQQLHVEAKSSRNNESDTDDQVTTEPTSLQKLSRKLGLSSKVPSKLLQIPISDDFPSPIRKPTKRQVIAYEEGNYSATTTTTKHSSMTAAAFHHSLTPFYSFEKKKYSPSSKVQKWSSYFNSSSIVGLFHQFSYLPQWFSPILPPQQFEQILDPSPKSPSVDDTFSKIKVELYLNQYQLLSSMRELLKTLALFRRSVRIALVHHKSRYLKATRATTAGKEAYDSIHSLSFAQATLLELLLRDELTKALVWWRFPKDWANVSDHLNKKKFMQSVQPDRNMMIIKKMQRPTTVSTFLFNSPATTTLIRPTYYFETDDDDILMDSLFFDIPFRSSKNEAMRSSLMSINNHRRDTAAAQLSLSGQLPAHSGQTSPFSEGSFSDVRFDDTEIKEHHYHKTIMNDSSISEFDITTEDELQISDVESVDDMHASQKYQKQPIKRRSLLPSMSPSSYQDPALKKNQQKKPIFLSRFSSEASSSFSSSSMRRQGHKPAPHKKSLPKKPHFPFRKKGGRPPLSLQHWDWSMFNSAHTPKLRRQPLRLMATKKTQEAPTKMKSLSSRTQERKAEVVVFEGLPAGRHQEEASMIDDRKNSSHFLMSSEKQLLLSSASKHFSMFDPVNNPQLVTAGPSTFLFEFVDSTLFVQRRGKLPFKTFPLNVQKKHVWRSLLQVAWDMSPSVVSQLLSRFPTRKSLRKVSSSIQTSQSHISLLCTLAVPNLNHEIIDLSISQHRFAFFNKLENESRYHQLKNPARKSKCSQCSKKRHPPLIAQQQMRQKEVKAFPWLYLPMLQIQSFLSLLHRTYKSEVLLRQYFLTSSVQFHSVDILKLYLPQVIQGLRHDNGRSVEIFLKYQTLLHPTIYQHLLYLLATEISTITKAEGRKVSVSQPDHLPLICERLLMSFQVNDCGQYEEFLFFDHLIRLSGQLLGVPTSQRDAFLKHKLVLLKNVFHAQQSNAITLPSNPHLRVIDLLPFDAKLMQSAAKTPFLLKFVVKECEGMERERQNKWKESKGLQIISNLGKWDNRESNRLTQSCTNHLRSVENATTSTGDAEMSASIPKRIQQQAIIFKLNDDIRHDQLAIQLIELFQKIFLRANLPLLLRPYKVIPHRVTSAKMTTSETSIWSQTTNTDSPIVGLLGGMIEVVPNAMSRHQLGRSLDCSLSQYFWLRYGDSDSHTSFEKILSSNELPTSQRQTTTTDDASNNRIESQTAFGISQKEFVDSGQQQLSSSVLHDHRIGGVLHSKNESFENIDDNVRFILDQKKRRRQAMKYTKGRNYTKAQWEFLRSLAAYSVASFLLQVKDRHNGNLLITREGQIVHIDFGFLFDFSPGRDLKFEKAPFKLTLEMIEILGGSADAEEFQLFEQLIIQGYLVIRQEAMLFLRIIAIMIESGLPCFKKKSLVNFRERFQLEASSEEAANYMRKQIIASYNSLSTRLYDVVQSIQQGIAH